MSYVAQRNNSVDDFSPNPNHALFLDSNIILLQKGKTSLCGNAKEIITKERLCEIYGENLCYSKELSYDEISFKPR